MSLHDEDANRQQLDAYERRFLEVVGENVRNTRLAARLSKEAVATAADLSVERYVKVERGDGSITLGELCLVGHVFGVLPVDLMRGAEDPRANG